MLKGEWIKREGYEKKIFFDENDLSCKGSLVQVVRLYPKTENKPHYHKIQTEVFVTTSGNGIIVKNNEKHRMKVGDIMICKPGDVHYVINDKDVNFDILVFKTNYVDDKDFYLEK